MNNFCQRHWLNCILPGLYLISSSLGHAHPAWLHTKVEGELLHGTVLNVDGTNRILQVAMRHKTGQTNKETLKITSETKLAILVPVDLDKIPEFSFVKLEGQVVDRQQEFIGNKLTVLPPWYPETPGFKDKSAIGIFRHNRKGELFIQAKRRMIKIHNQSNLKSFRLEERGDISSLRKGQEIILSQTLKNGIQTVTALCILDDETENER
ncbi:MAG: hypothetical protein HN467_00865 [Opitutae bacterium]|nr:hypothetical protein [Opitutae bacterium]